MILGQRVVVVLPAYRAAKTLRKTVAAIPDDVADAVILVDDASDDETVRTARELGLTALVHARNRGYGANQKTCYLEALRRRADIVVMLHPDYQYEPRLLTAMVSMVASGIYDVVLGSRILGGKARRGGMPAYKYISNRVLTAVQNLLLGTKLSEFHTGYRAFNAKVLSTLPLLANSDDFLFDNQVLVQCVAHGYTIGEISCPTRYLEEASSIGFRRSIVYGVGVLACSVLYRAWRMGLVKPAIFSSSDRLTVVHHTPDLVDS